MAVRRAALTIPREGLDEREHGEKDGDGLETPREECHDGRGTAAHAPLERELDETVDHVLVCRGSGASEGWGEAWVTLTLTALNETAVAALDSSCA